MVQQNYFQICLQQYFKYLSEIILSVCILFVSDLQINFYMRPVDFIS